jgi:hypothetical protein
MIKGRTGHDRMGPDGHFEHEDLIDFVEGEVTPELRDDIAAHLETCPSCGEYVESLRRTFMAVAADRVPDPSPGYWDYFEQRVRLRAGEVAGRPAPLWRWHLAFSWAAGIAAAAALAVLLWWLPGSTVRDIEPTGQGAPRGELAGTESAGGEIAQVDPVDVMLADLSTGEILESLAASPSIGLMLIEQDPDDIEEIDAYLSETGSIYDLVDEMDDEQMQIFMSSLKATMNGEDNTSAVTDGTARKGC